MPVARSDLRRNCVWITRDESALMAVAAMCSLNQALKHKIKYSWFVRCINLHCSSTLCLVTHMPNV